MKLEPETRVPNATRLTDADGAAGLDKHGQPLWDKPKPIRHTRHFKTAAARRRYNNGEISFDDATVQVPIFRAFDIRAYRALKRDMERAKRKQSRIGPVRKQINRWQSGQKSHSDAARSEQTPRDSMEEASRSTERAAKGGTPKPNQDAPSALTLERAVALVREHGSIRKAAEATEGVSKDKLRRRYNEAVDHGMAKRRTRANNQHSLEA